LAKRARNAAVVSAFGTVPSEVLFDVFDVTDSVERGLAAIGELPADPDGASEQDIARAKDALEDAKTAVADMDDDTERQVGEETGRLRFFRRPLVRMQWRGLLRLRESFAPPRQEGTAQVMEAIAPSRRDVARQIS
jgi:hypothetical protein